MEFSEVLNLILDSCPFLKNNDYDGIIVKKLAATNTISDTGASHQSHMAFTGKQKDFFPYLNADGYFNVGYESKDDDLKKYFTLQIPVTIYKENTDALTKGLFNSINYTSDKKTVKASVLRSRRNNGDDQIELSIKSLDDEDFIEFRKLLRVNDLFVLLKKKNCLEYDLVGIRNNDKNAESLSKCTDFYKLGTQTPVGMEKFEPNSHTIKTINKPHNCIIFGAPGTGKSHKLKEDSEQFENQEPIESDEKDIIKQEIIEANELNDKLNRYIAIGFSHSEFLKDYTTKQIRETFEIENCEDNIYVGAKAKFYYDKYIEDNEDDETITKRINEAKAIKGDGMLQVLAGIGFRFSETLMDYTKEELKKEYPLDSRPQIYWVYRAVHGAKYIKTKKKEKIKYLERVTFHPNYSYAQFVGTYKPVQDTADETQIKYEYVPGPFMRIYVAAKQNPSQNFLLLIEEINRANVAAVFGDVFQLLDRDENGNSEYPIAASEDIKKYLAKNGIHEAELKIPSNMYIWATMNSADQGVFPMDTAFKRRWEFEYIGIDENEDKVKVYEIPISATKKVNWNDLRKAINNKLITLGINEDKLLGPFFLSKTVLDSAFDKGMDFVKLFESKVLMYLFEDAAKMKAKQLFNVDEKKFIYSEVCKKFEAEGLNVFKFNEEDVVEEHDIASKKDDAPSDGKLF